MPSNSLEQQALDRVARMYSSYDRGRGGRHADRAPEPPQEKPESAQPEHISEPPAEEKSKPAGFLDTLMEDKEQSMILLLLVILMKDGADLNLILALLYLVI